MSEKYVQVPVSLPTREQVDQLWDQARADSTIPRTRDGAMAPVDAFRAGVAAMHALLSQPTPTAESLALSLLRAGEFQDEVYRIEDMTPGTTFTARVVLPGAVDDRFTVMDGPTNIWLRGEQYEVTVPDRIDPSTIRDVTPPEESNA